MNNLLELEGLDCLDSLQHILGINLPISSSSSASQDSYQYGTGNLISETYEWAWSDNHKDNIPSAVGFPGPVDGMIQARIQQQTRIKPYLNILLQSNRNAIKPCSQKAGSRKRIRKSRRNENKK